ncbi:MAG TPA: hypothetical protein VIQ30_18430 [Pseudonocardia sp.]
MNAKSYSPPALAELGSLHEQTLSWMVSADGHGFTGMTGFPFQTSVHCVKRPGRALGLDDHIGFTLPKPFA